MIRVLPSAFVSLPLCTIPGMLKILLITVVSVGGSSIRGPDSVAASIQRDLITLHANTRQEMRRLCQATHSNNEVSYAARSWVMYISETLDDDWAVKNLSSVPKSERSSPGVIELTTNIIKTYEAFITEAQSVWNREGQCGPAGGLRTAGAALATQWSNLGTRLDAWKAGQVSGRAALAASDTVHNPITVICRRTLEVYRRQLRQLKDIDNKIELTSILFTRTQEIEWVYMGIMLSVNDEQLETICSTSDWGKNGSVDFLVGFVDQYVSDSETLLALLLEPGTGRDTERLSTIMEFTTGAISEWKSLQDQLLPFAPSEGAAMRFPLTSGWGIARAVRAVHGFELLLRRDLERARSLVAHMMRRPVAVHVPGEIKTTMQQLLSILEAGASSYQPTDIEAAEPMEPVEIGTELALLREHIPQLSFVAQLMYFGVYDMFDQMRNMTDSHLPRSFAVSVSAFIMEGEDWRGLAAELKALEKAFGRPPIDSDAGTASGAAVDPTPTTAAESTPEWGWGVAPVIVAAKGSSGATRRTPKKKATAKVRTVTHATSQSALSSEARAASTVTTTLVPEDEPTTLATTATMSTTRRSTRPVSTTGKSSVKRSTTTTTTTTTTTATVTTSTTTRRTTTRTTPKAATRTTTPSRSSVQVRTWGRTTTNPVTLAATTTPTRITTSTPLASTIQRPFSKTVQASTTRTAATTRPSTTTTHRQSVTTTTTATSDGPDIRRGPPVREPILPPPLPMGHPPPIPGWPVVHYQVHHFHHYPVVPVPYFAGPYPAHQPVLSPNAAEFVPGGRDVDVDDALVDEQSSDVTSPHIPSAPGTICTHCGRSASQSERETPDETERCNTTTTTTTTPTPIRELSTQFPPTRNWADMAEEEGDDGR